jgi:hypothetical protein
MLDGNGLELQIDTLNSPRERNGLLSMRSALSRKARPPGDAAPNSANTTAFVRCIAIC